MRDELCVIRVSDQSLINFSMSLSAPSSTELGLKSPSHCLTPLRASDRDTEIIPLCIL